MTKELVFQSKDGKVYKKVNGGDSDDKCTRYMCYSYRRTERKR